MIKYILILILFLNTLNAKLSKDTIDIFNTQKMKLKELNTLYPTYDNMKYNQQKQYSKQIFDLVPNELFKKYVLKGKTDFKEFLILYAPLLNYKAYFMIDKMHKDKYMLEIGMNLAKINYKLYPKNIAYLDTYLWGMVRSNKDLKIALAGFSLILKQKKNDEIQKHYEYTLDLIEMQKKFSGIRAIKDIKKVINKLYFTKNKFDKKQLFKELNNIRTDDKDKFSKDVNIILEKYVNNEIKIINKNISKENNKNNITYNIKDKVLYISIKILSIDIYDKLKEIINKNEYQKIVLDLRDNSGGSFTTVREIISAFLPNEYKNIFFIEHKGKSWEMYGVIKDKTLNTTTPLEVIIDNKTKRGAMYIASVLSKQKRASIIGEYDKIDNSISRVIPLSNNWDVLLKFQNGFTFDDHRKLLKIYK